MNSVFFSIVFNKKIYEHPLVKNKVIPMIKKNFKDEAVSILNKVYSSYKAPVSKQEKEAEIYMYFLRDVIKTTINKYHSKNGWLRFGLFDDYIIWNGIDKTLDRQDRNTIFTLPVLMPDPIYSLTSSFSLCLKCKIGSANRDGESHMVMRIFFDNLEVTSPKDSSVCLLCEIPFSFLRRNNAFGEQEINKRDNDEKALLNIYNLKTNLLSYSNNSVNDVYKDEFGEWQSMTTDKPFTVGNDLVFIAIN
jgi:hypothetical protein